jgi:hypothetical protein
MVMKYVRLRIDGAAIVVAFDMCSSSDILEELTLKGEMPRYEDFLTKIKEYLADAQKKISFDPYKFTGDGWILLFPANTDGKALLLFLRNFCSFFSKEFRKHLLRYLDTPPRITGLKFGLEKGPLVRMTMYGATEYVGRALNIACRLQNAVRDKGGSPAYMALVSNTVYNDYFSPAKSYKVVNATRTLRNVRGGAKFRCKKIYLLDDH